MIETADRVAKELFTIKATKEIKRHAQDVRELLRKDEPNNEILPRVISILGLVDMLEKRNV
jgi:hypothetical protein